ncbi:MAG: 1-deoxy-D-xylulose-5-phosphate reductoisomerase [Gammaproteobacteria bacterium]|nr:1-deoxy-D-xylulose-5-phosphate reductoisomerase [Gammaproteobacteria bacterium]
MTTMRLTVLGSSGTIGINTLDLAARHSDHVEVFALAANSDHSTLLEQCRQHRPRYAALANADAAQSLQEALRAEQLDTEVLQGEDELRDLAGDTTADCVMAGIVGLAGLVPTLAAVRSGRRVLLANKESLVAGGQLFMDEVRRHGCELVPVDSEHNALFQCLAQTDPEAIERATLTASGGPFRETPLEQLDAVTPDQACAHPNWKMGRKISVDSATMMNKGLELMEARWLFGLDADRVDAVIHPESIVHALLTLRDGSTLAHLGPADMRVAISYALFGRQRLPSGVESLNLAECAPLNWYPPPPGRYPCLELARQAMQMGGPAPIILNAANEIAVDGFLNERIRFPQIADVVERTLEGGQSGEPSGIDDIIETDREARARARQAMEAL